MGNAEEQEDMEDNNGSDMEDAEEIMARIRNAAGKVQHYTGGPPAELTYKQVPTKVQSQPECGLNLPGSFRSGTIKLKRN